ncbi:MAG TPA: ADYC domain-containing protein [Polyangiaceae bacterium]|nr:ADYC domain-containing protein [Polyangiaceae bacterium]
MLCALAAGAASCSGTISFGVDPGPSGNPGSSGRSGKSRRAGKTGKNGKGGRADTPEKTGTTGTPDKTGTGGTPDKGGPKNPREVLPTNCQGEDCIIRTVQSSLESCPSGTCDPGPVNGKGVYVVTGGNYCLTADGPSPRFCPETFVTNTAGVRLLLHDAVDGRRTYESRVSATLATPAGEKSVDLIGVIATQTKLALRYRDGTSDRTATDAELEALRLQFTVVLQAPITSGPRSFAYELRFRPSDAGGLPDGMRRYEASYRLRNAPAGWSHHCAGEGKDRAASFLGGKKIDGLTAQVTNDGASVTMSCETGAIEACLAWGYAPWNAKARSTANGDYLFASCLQAKRAAYFVGRGDPTSYTKDHTPIKVRDPFGIMTNNAPPLEAIWSPRGAECLNGDLLRRPELRGTLAIPPGVPRCSPSWSDVGKLATGPGL